MFNRYYQQELSHIKELAVEFARAHPALAPKLSGPTSDPDVERLLEGVAFLTGLLRQKLDDEFPEVIHGLMDMIFPHYLRPLPSASILTFSPKAALRETMVVPRGTEVASLPVEGTACRFRTCYDVEAHPLSLEDARVIEQPGRPAQIQLRLSLMNINLSQWSPTRLRFHLGGDYVEASNLYLLLNRHIKALHLKPIGGGKSCTLGPEALRPVGFADHESLIPYPGQSFPGYRLLQEYFLMPSKFLFMDLVGLDQWTARGNGMAFDLLFELEGIPRLPLKVKKDHFVLSACPVINLFDHSADPISLDHRQALYLVRPAGREGGHHQVFSVDRLVGIVRGTAKQKEYVPFQHMLEVGKPVYQIVHRPSPIDGTASVYLSFPLPPGSVLDREETLSVQLSCTNGELPRRLQLGDISQPTTASPVLLDFRNILPPTMPIPPPLGNETLWQLLSHLSLNYLSLAEAGSLRELLGLYLFPAGHDETNVAANAKRIDGIRDVVVTPANRLVGEHMMRGQEIALEMRQDHFAGPGDMFLFGTILDRFFSLYASMNSFTLLRVQDTITGEFYRWQPRIGDRPLL